VTPKQKLTRVLFVCLGNICRSPTAHGVFRDQVIKAGLQDRIEIDSAGTGDWHVGRSPDKRAANTAANRGYDLSDLRARQVIGADFNQFNYILAMDQQNLRDLAAMVPSGFAGNLSLFLQFAENFSEQEVPDPYYGGEQGFEHVLDLVEDAAQGLLHHIRSEHF